MHRDSTGYDPLTLLEGAVHITQQLVDGLDPADLALPTPCAEYDVRLGKRRLVADLLADGRSRPRSAGCVGCAGWQPQAPGGGYGHAAVSRCDVGRSSRR